MSDELRPRHRGPDGHRGDGTGDGALGGAADDAGALVDGFVDDLFGDDEDAYTVRPYAVSGGRTAPTSDDIPVEALVQGLSAPDVGLPPEKRVILELTATQYLSVAELSAHLKLPVGVTRVLVSDLAEAGRARVHGLPTSPTHHHATSLSVLESVLNGISSL